MKASRILLICMILLALAGAVQASPLDKLKALTADASLKFIAVNFAVVAIAVFLFQQVALPKREKQEILYMIVAGAVGLFVALKFGRTQYIWEIGQIANFLHMKVIINAAVISAALIFIKGMTLDRRPEFRDNRQAQIGSAILVIILAVYIAMAPFRAGETWESLGDGKKYKYIWQKDTAISIRLYLLGDPQCYSFDDFKVDKRGDKDFLKAPDGKTYYRKIETETGKPGPWKRQDKIRYLGIGDWLSPDNLFGESSKLNEWYEVADDVRSKKKLDPERIEDVNRLQEEIKRNAKSGRYCYTEKSFKVLRREEKLSDQDKYHPTDNNPLKGFGILRGNQLFILILLILTGYLLFTHFKLSEKPWLNWGLAIYIAVNVAHQGAVGRNMVIWFFQFALWLMFWKSMTAGTAAGKEGRWSRVFYGLLAAGLVLFLGHLAFPGQSFEIPLMPKDFNGMVIWTVLSILGATIVAGGMVVAVIKGKTNIITDGISSGYNKLLAFGKRIGRVTPGIKRFRTFAISWPEDEIHDEVRRLKVEFFTLMNWMLRMEVYVSKNFFVQLKYPEILAAFAEGGEIEIDKDIKIKISRLRGYRTIQDAIFGIKRYGEGRNEWVMEPNGSIGLRHKFIYHRDQYNKLKRFDMQSEVEGAFSSFGFIRLLFNLLHQWARVGGGYQTTACTPEVISRFKEETVDSIVASINEHYNNYLMQSAKEGDDDTGGVVVKFGSRWNRLCTLQYIRGLKYILLDQYAMSGERMRGWQYAAPNAPYQLWQVNIRKEPHSLFYSYNLDLYENVNRLGSPELRQNFNMNQVIGRPQPALADRDGLEREDPLFEVDNHGWVIDDLNAIKFGNFNQLQIQGNVQNQAGARVGHAYVRKIKKEDIIWPNEDITARRLSRNWEEFVRQMKYGEYTPYSLTVEDYKIRHAREERAGWVKSRFDLTYKTIPDYSTRAKVATDIWPDMAHPAFDREALKDPGAKRWWGFKNYWQEDRNLLTKIRGLPPLAPYPSLSAKGLSEYIISRLGAVIYEMGKRAEEMKNWVFFKGPEDLFTTVEQEKTQGGTQQ